MNEEKVKETITVTLNYSEVAGLKGGKSREFETDQIILFKEKLPIFEVVSNNLQYPLTIGGTTAMEEEEREDLILEYLDELKANAISQIVYNRKIREENRKREEAEEQKRLANTLEAHIPKVKRKSEEEQ
jgi:hypothetical protein